MKVMMINGSPHSKGNTALALDEMRKIFEAEGVEVSTVHVGNKLVRGCIACRKCFETGKCVFDDIVNESAPLFEAADGFVVATPVYYASANGTVISFLDRLFFSTPFDKTMKVGAGIAIARRAGTTATYDELNKYFGINGMPIAPSQYWSIAFGLEAGDVTQDAEGMQTMRTLARNMIFMMRSIALGKEKFGLPEREEWIPTHFIR
ncbi:MAG: flavodoxin family protein [Selenomonadaceae bacterium]|nr:flavodoxin family protein [Selenomonadaceae bacterium]